jgi:hypothetical protein
LQASKPLEKRYRIVRSRCQGNIRDLCFSQFTVSIVRAT